MYFTLTSAFGFNNGSSSIVQKYGMFTSIYKGQKL